MTCLKLIIRKNDTLNLMIYPMIPLDERSRSREKKLEHDTAAIEVWKVVVVVDSL